ncbi:hypothetical protein [Spirosoma koreense]
MKRFIHDCERKGFLKPDSGFIDLTEWTDNKGQLNWQVAAREDWQSYTWMAPFRGYCRDCYAPSGWTKVSNRLVIRYDYNQREDTLTKAEASCLQQLVGQYARILPPKPIPPKMVPQTDPKGQPVLDKDGKPKMWEYFPSVITMGSSGGNNSQVIFQKDGKVRIGLSL